MKKILPILTLLAVFALSGFALWSGFYGVGGKFDCCLAGLY